MLNHFFSVNTDSSFYYMCISLNILSYTTIRYLKFNISITCVTFGWYHIEHHIHICLIFLHGTLDISHLHTHMASEG